MVVKETGDGSLSPQYYNKIGGVGMPRKARIKSQTNIYHIILRGINRQQIFFDDEDYFYFETLLKRYKEECQFKLPAYCLMGNHIHLLIIEEGEPLELIIKRIGSAFVYWYNNKYERSGHLFQDRFKSEPIESEKYFLTVFRYILNNPVKANICQRAEEYFHSSAREYLCAEKGISDQSVIKDILGDCAIREYVNTDNDDKCLEVDNFPKHRSTDKVAKLKIMKVFGTYTPIVGSKNRDVLNNSICQVINEGVSIRQLSRLTGLSKKIIEKALKQ